jgi:Flp pilus assembly protein TadG
LVEFAHGHQGTQGLAAVELALLAPIVALVFICTADLGLGLYQLMEVESAAEAGVQYAALYGFDSNKISGAVTAAAPGLTINLDPTPSQSCGCPSGTAISAATCGSTCPNSEPAGTYVKVSTSSTYNTLIPYPILPSSFPLSATATVRIQ